MWPFNKNDTNSTNETKNDESNTTTSSEPLSAVKRESNENSLIKRMGFVILFLIVSLYLLGVYWSVEPSSFEVKTQEAYQNQGSNKQLIVGYTTLHTAEKVASTLMEKNGGYLSNDVLPPSIFLDNIPAWEFGVIVQLRDIASVLRNDMSRSQSQSMENSDLSQAEPLFNYSHSRWLIPASEGKYQEAIEKLASFRQDLKSKAKPDVQFYARADNLETWFGLVNKRLGGLSQRLSASVGQERLNTDLAGDSAAVQSTQVAKNIEVKTPWLEIDNTFYEARGACWALIHLLKAIEIDFAPVLEKKNAKASLAQVIRELEATQETVWSPLILNGSGFGVVANHSLVMANYISRANAGLIDLRELLING